MARQRFRLNPLLWLIYNFLRSAAWLGAQVYYRHRLVLGREHLRFEGPAIVIVNHPCTLMDVLNTGIHIRPEMFFLANYGLFKNPVSNWVFRKLFCIPVKRREDVAEGEERNNDDAFEQSYQHLEKGGVLFIAPEGTSWMNRFVRPLKTGTARIAFGAEARNDWALDVKIIPIGLSYAAPNLFRSTVVVQFGEAVYPRDWAADWQADPGAGAEKLTRYLEERLKTLSIHTRDEAGEQYFTRLESMWQHERPLPTRAEFARAQTLARTSLDDTALRAKTTAYFQELEKHGLQDRGLALINKPNASLRTAYEAFMLALGAPFFLAGYAAWFLPCFVPWLIAKRLKLYVGYDSTVKILAGLFISFPLALWAYFRLAGAYLPNAWCVWSGLLLLIGLGWLTEQYQGIFDSFRLRWKTLSADRALLAGLNARRREILDFRPQTFRP